MEKFTSYPIFKKRDGQSFKEVGSIYTDGFIEAKKEFAKNCANDLHNECWLTYLTADDFDKKGIEAGFYLNERLVYNENETVNVENSYIECFLSQKSIDKGFDTFSEDVYTWELREPLEYEEIFDFDDFENEKEKYNFFMAVEGERFFLYNGDFSKIAENEFFPNYSDTNDKFIGCAMDDVQFIENYLK